GARGGEIGIEEAEGGGSQFWFTLPAVIVRAAPEDTRALDGMTIAIVSRNAILREGLSAQVRASGGVVMEMREDYGARPDLVLVDAGTDAEPNPPATLGLGVPSL